VIKISFVIFQQLGRVLKPALALSISNTINYLSLLKYGRDLVEAISSKSKFHILCEPIHFLSFLGVLDPWNPG